MKLTKSQRYYIYTRDDRKCRFCGKALTYRQMTIDHYCPRGAGGPTEVFNLVACCRQCNKEKYDRVPADAPEVQIDLFRRAALEGIIRPDQSRIKEWDVSALAGIDTVHTQAAGTVFEGGGYRIFVRRGQIIRVVRYRLHAD